MGNCQKTGGNNVSQRESQRVVVFALACPDSCQRLAPFRVSASEQQTTGFKNVLSATYDELVSITRETRDATVETQLERWLHFSASRCLFSHKLSDGSADL